jgi:putative ABC transport system permease protein
MKRALMKDTLRELWRTRSRFLAIFAIIALGTGFFAGIKVTCPDMKLTADKYFQDYHLMDLKIVSTYGLNRDDIKAIGTIGGIKDIMPAYSMDAIIKTNDEDRVAKVHSIPLDKMKSSSNGYINRIRVIDGRLPEKSGECVVEKSKITAMNLKLGDKITLDTGEKDKDISEFVNKDKFEIVGYVETPYYLTFEKGTSSLGNGTVSMYVMIPEEDFNMEVHTETFLTFDSTAGISAFTQDYTSAIAAKKTELETLARKREDQRYSEIYNEAKVKLDDSKKDLAAGEKKQAEELTKALDKLELGRIDIEKGRRDLEEKHSQVDKMIVSTQTQLMKAQLKVAKERLDNAELELTARQEEYDTQKKESNAKFEDARKKIADSEKIISEIKKPKWYVLDRNNNAGYASYEDDTGRIDAIAKIFPVFFFIVAAFVCLTTMTRMVEEHRTQIGTYKALGYGNLAIASKFLIYAAIASIFGSVVGLTVGLKLFPYVITDAYSMLYKLPSVIMPLRIDYIFWITLGALVCTSTAVYLACYNELREHPASLMRPKSPKMGKRVFLERVPFIWSRLNFFSKVTLRNLFRYKKRLIMTLLGVAGCTALMLSGFGVRDAISSIVPLQYGEVFEYNSMIIIDENAKAVDKTDAVNILENNGNIKDMLNIRLKNLEAGSNDGWQKINLLVPQDTSQIDKFISIHEMDGKKPIDLTDNGVVIGEKLAKVLKLKVGSKLTIKEGEFKKVTVKVVAINENYTLHYVYMTPSLYEKVFGEKLVLNSILVNMQEVSKQAEDKISKDLVNNNAILQVNFTSSNKKSFSDMVNSLNSIVFVMIISAGALAFVVLYNLTNINITERIREIASIKVLGFYDLEVSKYVFRENIILTVMDTFIGLLGGIVLNKFVLQTSETDVVMFGREIYWYSYVLAAALTIAFAVLVNILMHFKLKKISMIESLKSVE